MQIDANSDDFKIPLKASFSTGKAADTNANLVELYVTTADNKQKTYCIEYIWNNQARFNKEISRKYSESELE